MGTAPTAAIPARGSTAPLWRRIAQAVDGTTLRDLAEDYKAQQEQ